MSKKISIDGMVYGQRGLEGFGYFEFESPMGHLGRTFHPEAGYSSQILGYSSQKLG